MTDDRRDFRYDEARPALTENSTFEDVLRYAEERLKDGDTEGGLMLLLHLEQHYVNAVRLFDLLGEAFTARGDSRTGAHYKSLYQVLKGSFHIAQERKKVAGVNLPGQLGNQPGVRLEGTGDEPSMSSRRPADTSFPTSPEEQAGTDNLFPVTPSMGHEFMRQGHYDRAVEIFDLLLRRRPNDEALKEARAGARKKHRDQQLMHMLQTWLANIQRLKGQHSARP